jgi:hypothetical protein
MAQTMYAHMNKWEKNQLQANHDLKYKN